VDLSSAVVSSSCHQAGRCEIGPRHSISRIETSSLARIAAPSVIVHRHS